MTRLRVGLIPFGNLFPIFHILKNEFDCAEYEFIEGVPSELNNLLRNGHIDLSPSSSVEYLMHKDIYSYIQGHSISSQGKVGSIYLFSKKPIEELNGLTVKVTSQSATSIELLRIITTKFYHLKLQLLVSPTPQKDSSAFLLIGDEALRQYQLVNEGLFIYDLGELWHKQTSLPFVFALWIVKKDRIVGDKIDIFKKFTIDLDEAKKIALNKLDEIATISPLSKFMTKDKILEYWSKLDYDLTDRHMEGLHYFDRLIKKENDL